MTPVSKGVNPSVARAAGCPSALHGVDQHCEQELERLCKALASLPEIAAKRAISVSAGCSDSGVTWDEKYALPGDDCAAFKMPNNDYQLFAMEGMRPDFVAGDPRAAGWSSVMANASDIAAMGGRPTALVNAFWHHSHEHSQLLLANIKRACDTWNIAFAGGHSNIAPSNTANLAVAIVGYAKKLLSCHHLLPGQRLFMLTDLSGSWHGDLPYWGCVTGKTAEQIRQQWDIPAQLAERDLAVAAKDISGGGTLGTLIMMLELTGCGAVLDLSSIPQPPGDLLRWLRAFQSYGFLLAVEPDKVSQIIHFFKDSHLSCCPIGSVTDDALITLDYKGCKKVFWDVNADPLTDMGTVHTRGEPDAIC